MSKRKDGQTRGKYTLEFKMEAVRLVKGGQSVPAPALGAHTAAMLREIGHSDTAIASLAAITPPTLAPPTCRSGARVPRSHHR